MREITDKEIDRFYGEYEAPAPYSEKVPAWYIQTRRKIMTPKKDCFAFRRVRCNILTEMVCRCGDCSFYKTMQDYRKDREKYGFDKNYGLEHREK